MSTTSRQPRKRVGRLQSGGVIREAATALFLRNGYLGTSMDEIAALASCLERLAERGLMRLDDHLLAARHFVALVLWVPLDRAMFVADADVPTAAELERLADAGVRVFLAAYGLT